MTLPPEDRDLIERVLGYDADENVKTLLLTPSDLAKLFAAVRAEAAPSSPGDGWVMVPREPTDEMLLKGHHQIDWGRDDQPTNTNDDPLQKPGGVGTTCKEDLRDAYRAMLSSAPSPGGDHEA